MLERIAIVSFIGLCVALVGGVVTLGVGFVNELDRRATEVLKGRYAIIQTVGGCDQSGVCGVGLIESEDPCETTRSARNMVSQNMTMHHPVAGNIACLVELPKR